MIIYIKTGESNTLVVIICFIINFYQAYTKTSLNVFIMVFIMPGLEKQA